MTDSDAPAILIDKRDGIAVLTLNRPERHNAITLAMVRSIEEILAEVDADPDLHVSVVTGAGRSFCAGGDLTELIPLVAEEGLGVAVPDRTKRMLSDVKKPVIAAVNGPCLAGGLELLLGTDIRLASPEAYFAAPEVGHGLFAGGGTHVRLARQIPFAVAQELVLTGRRLSAERAMEVGLVNAVIPRERLLDEALVWARGIVAAGPLAVRAAKEAMVSTLGLEEGFRTESLIADRVFSSADAREGLAAFAERRPPVFEGR